MTELTITRMAHGGEGIAELDGRVVFVRGAYPGDVVAVELTQEKKRFARAQVTQVIKAGPLRVEQACPAAAAGAGCCDFGDLDPAAETQLKADILLNQLARLGRVDNPPRPELHPLEPVRGWRSRVRLGVDKQGRAGFRALGGHEIIPIACTQVVPELIDGLLDRTYTPGSEVVAVLDSAGQRHVVETRKAPRARRVEKVEKVLEGSGTVTEHADGHTFQFPATGFWQAHIKAADAYTGLVRAWLADLPAGEGVGWDLYGGVGLFVPALIDALGDNAVIHSVDYSTSARSQDFKRVEWHNTAVEKAIGGLPAPRVVVLDPPRTGAGDAVVAGVAKQNPERVIHVGCDPATFSRDVAAWGDAGYRITRLAVLNAFPGTHHFEVMAELSR
ncbi:MAG: TRAM domain-containing protein [Corynebacterium sp.]|uniref:class I SAM-dependent RNA methyltransferase n=1 Tax=Corynebacterium sp. TaxID=1720 RepID=UPI0026E074F4|nr:TRAM domain-containing protein [Corynebacterium sp.]MDO5670881.1 TRAM domain-containing protein [Corynebacterium sp.]